MNIAKKDGYLNWSAQGLFEYRLIINPDALVSEKVKEEKAQLHGDYQREALSLQSGITVASFLAREPMEATLMRWIQRICDFQEQFMVTLNNYSGFPPDTIYLRIQEPTPFGNLARQLKSVDDWVQSSACPPMNLVAKPYLSIARRLPEPVYTKAMFSYSQRIFHESFMATELRLLRRAHSFEPSKTIHVFPLARTHQYVNEREIA